MANLMYFAALMMLYTVYVQGKYVEVKKVEKCPVENPADLDFELVTLDDGTLALNLKVTYDYDIDDTYKLDGNFFQLKNGNWEKTTSYEDKWCVALLPVAKPWSIAKAKIQPPLPDGCTIPSGEYSLHEFQLNKEDVESIIRSMNPGTYTAKVMLVTGAPSDREEILCVSVEYDVKDEL